MKNQSAQALPKRKTAPKSAQVKPRRPLRTEKPREIEQQSADIPSDWKEVAMIVFPSCVDRDCQERIIYKTSDGTLKACRSDGINGPTKIEDVTRSQVAEWIRQCTVPEEFAMDFLRIDFTSEEEAARTFPVELSEEEAAIIKNHPLHKPGETLDSRQVEFAINEADRLENKRDRDARLCAGAARAFLDTYRHIAELPLKLALPRLRDLEELMCSHRGLRCERNAIDDMVRAGILLDGFRRFVESGRFPEEP